MKKMMKAVICVALANKLIALGLALLCILTSCGGSLSFFTSSEDLAQKSMGSLLDALEEGNYTIVFRECVSDNVRWGNVGIHSLRVYHTEDEDIYFPHVKRIPSVR